MVDEEQVELHPDATLAPIVPVTILVNQPTDAGWNPVDILIRYRDGTWHQILINRAHRRLEIDWFAPGTYTLAMEWLERNYRRKDFFLWIDTFDPHEPWDPPQHYIDLYDPGYKGRVFESPTYGLRKKMGITDRELKHIRARYAAEVTMVDTWFGRLIGKLEALGILDETIVIFTSDHGTQFDGPGGLAERKPTSSPRKIYLMQRKTSKVGGGLGKTSGWVHRNSLKHRDVEMLRGCSYEKIDDDGLHITLSDKDGKVTESKVLAVDNVIICAGQEPFRALFDDLVNRGIQTHLIGGADVAEELDAKRAIRQGTEVAARIWPGGQFWS
jgi:hypothetical protein